MQSRPPLAGLDKPDAISHFYPNSLNRFKQNSHIQVMCSTLKIQHIEDKSCGHFLRLPLCSHITNPEFLLPSYYPVKVLVAPTGTTSPYSLSWKMHKTNPDRRRPAVAVKAVVSCSNFNFRNAKMPNTIYISEFQCQGKSSFVIVISFAPESTRFNFFAEFQNLLKCVWSINRSLGSRLNE